MSIQPEILITRGLLEVEMEMSKPVYENNQDSNFSQARTYYCQLQKDYLCYSF